MAPDRKRGCAICLFFFVGCLVAEKGIQDSSTAFHAIKRRHQNLRLGFVGDGPLRSDIATAQTSSEGRIFGVGRLSGNDLWGAYAGADLFVGSSRVEPWGLVVNEAMAAGLPVVVSDRFGCVDDLVHDNDTGLVFRVADVAHLTAVLDRAMRHPFGIVWPPTQIDIFVDH